MSTAGWETRWLVGQNADKSFAVVEVKARPPADGFCQVNTRPGCRTPMIVMVPESRVYATLADAERRKAELEQDST